MSKFTELRSEPRYPIRAGFIEINDQPYPLDDLSVRGLGFKQEAGTSFTPEQTIQGFLVLQDIEEQYEMPVTLVVRRIEDGRVGCSMSCVIPYHGEVITGFLENLKNGKL